MGEGDLGFVETVGLLTDGQVPLKKYKSKATGLTVCIAEAAGPVVAGYLCVATEAHDDDGLPHTLEHLVFLGSEKYPYKGVLDLLANRCLASGTNAWTDSDHTCYTMTTAGDEGFLKLLPAYVDHLLYPTLTDSAFVTEVHHINGEGEDAGVVYCEMQGSENTGESRCYHTMLQHMYPGHCGYRSEFGGKLKNLRESTSNEKVRNYHRAFYRPENLCIIIVGQIKAEDVFNVLKSAEDKVLGEEPRPPFMRPWQSEVSSIEESCAIEVEYPCDEDEFGLVMAAWRGPDAKDYSKIIPVQILMEYLTDTSISCLQRDFVENDDPYCSQVDYSIMENSVCCIYLHFSNVPVDKLSLMEERVCALFKKIAEGEEVFDMKRMKTVIEKKKLYIISRMESDPHDHLAMAFIGDFLYGNKVEDLQHRVQQIPVIEELFLESEEYWRNMLNSYMVEGKYVFILGRPSPQLAKTMSDEEKQRIEKQREKLGPEGLALHGDILTKAMNDNEIPPPEEMLSSVSVPSVQSIKFHSVQRDSNWLGKNDDTGFCLDSMPCRFQVDVVSSSFVRIFVVLDTSDVSQDLRLFIPLFIELIAESSVERDGKIIPYQEVVKELANDTVSVSVSIGFNYSRFYCISYAQTISLSLVVKEECYSKAVQWINEILYKTVFEPSRIKSVANKMITDVARMRRDGDRVTRAMIRNICFSHDSNHWASSMMRQHSFLTKTVENLSTDPNEVVNSLCKLRALITKPEKLTVHIALNLPNIRQKLEPETVWLSKLLPSELQPEHMKGSIRQCYELLKGADCEYGNGYITGIGSVESSFLMQCAPCINSYENPDCAALLVLIQYLVQVEGPMWKQIRGMGLSYGYNMAIKPNEGLIYFSLFKSTHLVKAYNVAYSIIESYLNQETPWDTSLLESAASSLAYELIENEKTISDVIQQSVFAYYRNVDMNFTKKLLENVFKVTTDDMERVGTKYLRQLFNPTISNCSICCHSSKVEDIVAGFKQLSRKLIVVPSLDDSFMTSY